MSFDICATGDTLLKHVLTASVAEKNRPRVAEYSPESLDSELSRAKN